MKQYHTTESLAALLGMTGTNARNRIHSGEWKPSAQTISGKALFSEAAVVQITVREQSRRDGRASKRNTKAEATA